MPAPCKNPRVLDEGRDTTGLTHLLTR